MRKRPWYAASRMRRTLLRSAWLPLGMVVLALLRFAFDPGVARGPEAVAALPAMAMGLAFTWPAGIPLTLALERLHPRSRALALACGAALCPLSVAAVTVGGLFGPIGIWAYAGIVSLPAWLAFGLLVGLARLRARRRAA